MNVYGLLDLVLSDFESLVAVILRFEVTGLEVVQKRTDFGSLVFNLGFEMMSFYFLSRLFILCEELLG